MLAVAVLIVVILAAAKIFATASKVAGLSAAGIDIMQDVGAIQRQIQADLAELSPEGFFAIRCVAVRNDVNFPVGGPLLNPLLPEKAILRADQLMFFTNAVHSLQTFRAGQGMYHKPQSTVARVYYGHGFQLPDAERQNQTVNAAFGLDSGEGLFPWTIDAPSGGPSLDVLSLAGAPLPKISGSQPPATKWILARQAVLLADDGGATDVFLGQGSSADSIWGSLAPAHAADIRNGRVDAAATQLNDIRRRILFDSTGALRNWDAQRDEIGDAMFYPRVERYAYSMDRVDQALTNSALASACSSFTIDWTYDAGTGEVTNQIGQTFTGVVIHPGEQPWFGLDFLPTATATSDPVIAVGDQPGVRGVRTFTRYVSLLATADQPQTMGVYPLAAPILNSVERIPVPPSINMLGTTFTLPTGSPPPVQVYEAFFGYNQADAIHPTFPADGPVHPPPATPTIVASPPPIPYTPWPSAIRITMTLHDTNTRLEAGREVQFIIHLPRRGG